MSNPNDIPRESAQINGMELTEAEAKLAAEPIDAVDPKTMVDGQTTTDVLGGPSDPTPADPAPDPAPTPAVAAAQPDPAPAPVPSAPVQTIPSPPEAPASPKDFDALARELQAKYETGDLTSEEYAAQTRALSREEAQYIAQKAIYDKELETFNRLQQAQAAQAEQEWNAAALQWERQNADFMSNPLRQEAMRQAISAVDRQTGGTLPPAEVLQQAEKIAFEAFNYKRVDTDAATKAALANRAPNLSAVPPSLGSAPNAGGEDVRGNETFNALDRLEIGDLEDTLSRMSPQQREAYLLDAPGARSTGRE